MGFEVVSDLEESSLGDLLRMLNRFEAWATPYLPGEPTTSRVPMRMLIFSSHEAFRRYFGSTKFAGFMAPSLATSTVVIAPFRGDRALNETAMHEYSHYLLRNRLDISLPLWFDEGLATLLASVEFDDNEATLGRLPLEDMRRLTARNNLAKVSLQQVIEADYMLDWSRQRIDGFYYWSWLITHYLMLADAEQRQALDDFLTQRKAPLNVYLDTSYRGLERTLRRYVHHHPPHLTQPSPDPAAIEFKYDCLSDLERDLFIGDAIADHNPGKALELADLQLSTHPADARLLLLQSRAHAALNAEAQALDLAQKAFELAPENPAVLVNLGDRLVADCLLRQSEQCWQRWREALPYYQQALQLDNNRIDAVFGIGLSYLHAGRPGQAVNYLKVAYSRTPWAVHVNFYLGESYRIIGDTRARGYLENARNWSQNEVWRRLAELALLELES